ncbi:Imm50 family immunity protein [Streptomyces sp. NPDC050548]|uniref:Imm50 family immunity protein n=1 Tax=Streptomyces sp. NPDC050548 TaxID=3365629 RepID=UPI003790DF80
MIHPWVKFLDPNSRLRDLYGKFPERSEVQLQSLCLRPAGPTILMRLDLPVFPEKVPAAWALAGCDTVQVTLEFLAADEVRVSLPQLPRQVEISGYHLGEQLAAFRVSGQDLDVRFRAFGRLRAGHVSAYRRQIPGDAEEGRRHYFLGAVDSKLYQTVPDPWNEAFHGKL